MAHTRGKVAAAAMAVVGTAALLVSLVTSGGSAAANASQASASQASAKQASASQASPAGPTNDQAKTFSNPVLGPGQDPSVVTYRGWYYFTQSAPDAKSITIRRARS
ncbi:MAG TPA: hypothetical protein VG268_09275, partial [Streptosporangiaceae bacterium]|nr:hypothetical protein [Streptosporangiaceae bacterium]